MKQYFRLVFDFVVYLLDMLVPRFITEDVAIEWIDEGGYDLVCPMKWVEPDEEFDGIVTVKYFNLFGFGLFPKCGEVRPFENPHNR